MFSVVECTAPAAIQLKMGIAFSVQNNLRKGCVLEGCVLVIRKITLTYDTDAPYWIDGKFDGADGDASAGEERSFPFNQRDVWAEWAYLCLSRGSYREMELSDVGEKTKT